MANQVARKALCWTSNHSPFVQTLGAVSYRSRDRVPAPANAAALQSAGGHSFRSRFTVPFPCAVFPLSLEARRIELKMVFPMVFPWIE